MIENIQNSSPIDVYEEYFESDSEIQIMRETFTPEFYKTWDDGYQNYIGGNWK